ncbi:hypothetical protein M3Y99_01624800 [Aphelenchoides fujianensis]|nr:hypothetical protein M3Y99_01624800 [Aphelenchoides fujianensis]
MIKTVFLFVLLLPMLETRAVEGRAAALKRVFVAAQPEGERPRVDPATPFEFDGRAFFFGLLGARPPNATEGALVCRLPLAAFFETEDTLPGVERREEPAVANAAVSLTRPDRLLPPLTAERNASIVWAQLRFANDTRPDELLWTCGANETCCDVDCCAPPPKTTVGYTAGNRWWIAIVVVLLLLGFCVVVGLLCAWKRDDADGTAEWRRTFPDEEPDRCDLTLRPPRTLNSATSFRPVVRFDSSVHWKA